MSLISHINFQGWAVYTPQTFPNSITDYVACQVNKMLRELLIILEIYVVASCMILNVKKCSVIIKISKRHSILNQWSITDAWRVVPLRSQQNSGRKCNWCSWVFIFNERFWYLISADQQLDHSLNSIRSTTQCACTSMDENFGTCKGEGQ